MNLQNIHSYSGLRQAGWKSDRQEEAKETAKTQEGSVPVRQDRFERTGSQQPVTYQKKGLTDAQVEQLKADQQQRMESFRQMLQSMVVKQGQQSNLTLFGMSLYVTPEQSRQAAASIAEGGEYSVDAVATRIMDMAKALSGGDASKLEELRDAVEKGFAAAGAELGGKLPGICQDTYTEVMKRFDDWAAQAQQGETAAD